MGLLTIILIGIGVVAIVVGSILLSKNLAERKKEHSTPATVVNKRVQEVLRKSGLSSYYFVLFGTGANSKIELLVTKEQFEAIEVGTSGTLTYKAATFISFLENEQGAEL